MCRTITKIEALREIISQARTELAGTNTSAKRLLRAGLALELQGDELKELFIRLDYARPETGEPYGKDIKRVWP